MNRRNFLLSSGMIGPAVLLMPDLVVADLQQDDADCAMLQAGGGRVSGLAARFRGKGKRVKEVNIAQVSGISWNGQRFRLSTRSGYSFTVKRLVINSAYMVDRGRGLVVIPAAPEAMVIPFEAMEGVKELPAFWVMPGKLLQDAHLAGFMGKSGGGFMCIA